MSRGSMPTQKRTAPAEIDPPLRPLNAPLVRIDSGLVCDGCGGHVDTTGRCRCS